VRKTNRPSDWQARFFEEDAALKQIRTRLDAAQ
jgi:formate dehydrogenase major subunit